MAWLKDGQRVIRHLKAHKSKQFQVPADYAYEFRLALTTFHHQRVWSPRARAVVPLTPLPPAPPPVASSPPGATPPGATGVAAGSPADHWGVQTGQTGARAEPIPTSVGQ